MRVLLSAALTLTALVLVPPPVRSEPPKAAPVAPLKTDVEKAKSVARLEERIPPLMKEADVPGLSIALVRDGELVWHRGFGVKNSKTKAPVDDATVFEAASLSKPVFAYAVLKLVDAGKFDLDKPLNQYLPGNYDVGDDPRLGKITARHVLSHTTGFPNWRGDGNLKIHFPPGERFSYSGEGFVYLAKVIEHVTGETFNDVLKRVVFEPLGMTSSSFIWREDYDKSKTFRHNAIGEATSQGKPPAEHAKAGNAAASMQTTAQDYGRFVTAILKGTGLKPDTRKLMLTPQVQVRAGGANSINRPEAKPVPDVAWGIGWGLQTTQDGLSFWHWGDNGDSKAYIVAFDKPQLAVVYFANSANGLSIARDIVAEAVGGAQPALDWLDYERYNSPRRALFKQILAKGAEVALREYQAKGDGQPAANVITENQMNNMGYDLLGLKRVDDALEVFKRNVKLHPDSGNAYDSLAEGYEAAGDKASAIKNFKKSLELNPKNTNAIEHLKKLEDKNEAKPAPPLPAPLQTNVKPVYVAARLEESVPPLMKEADVPGLSIALVRDGELVWHRGFGVKNSKTKAPVDDATVFEAASLSKPVFAYAVLKLVDAGKFDLDKPLNRYMPGNFDVDDERLNKITARHVLTHTTGFANGGYTGKTRKMFFAPGERFSYSGDGFEYLWKVIEYVTGEPLDHFVKRMAFGPLGMTHTSFTWLDAYDKSKAGRHNPIGESTGQGKPPPERAKQGNLFRLHTTAEDYGRFVVATFNGTGLKPETRKLWLTPQVQVREGGASSIDRPEAKLVPDVAWGLGWGLQTTQDGLSFWHWGDSGDSKAFVVAFDKPKLAVVYFANSANGLSIAREIVTEAVGGAQPGLDWLDYERYNSPRRALFKQILAKGAGAALREYRTAQPANAITENQMNNMGYDLLSLKRVDDALEVFKLNVGLHPESGNAYDSLAEGYEAAGDKGAAIKNFKKSLELNPKNTNAVEHLKKLEDKKGTNPSAPAKPAADPSEAVEAFLRGQMQKRRIPGLQVAIVQHGKIVHLGAYGVANIQDSVPVDNRTLFTINSVTKAFTGVAIMQLVEDGKLDLTAPASRYLDGLPAAWKDVTVRQLLTHTSGLPNVMDSWGELVVPGDGDASRAKVLTLPMEFAPGERFSYNQTNYLLLGQIIEKLGGRPFTQFIKERQLQAAGMPLTTKCGFVDSRDVVPHSARGYSYIRKVGEKVIRSDKIGNVFEEFPPFLRTAAGMSSTAEEMAHWIIALQQGQLLKEKTSLSALWASGVLNNGSPGGFGGLLRGYALGWTVTTRPEHRAVGGIGGGRSAFLIYPDDDLAVVILTNLQGSSPEDFIDEIAGHYVPDMHPATGFGLPPAIKALHTELMKRGFADAVEAVGHAKKKEAKIELSESDVNAWGYRLLELGRAGDAVEIFKLNAHLYPESANAYDSLAEGYEAAGDNASAIKNFKKSLELNPKNANAVEHLKTLEDPKPAPPKPPVEDRPDTVETFLRGQMQKRRIPGLQVAVVQRGKIVHLGAYGTANVEHSVPVTHETVFSINSATKSFTGVAIMQLVEDGKLDLSAPVSRYLDDLPRAWRAVTVRQLLSLTSGIPGISGDGDEAAAWAKVQTLPMEFEPGERFGYSQTNYLLLGRIIDKLQGEPFTRFISERQFRAVKMPRTGFGDSSDIVPHSAQAYTTLQSVGGQYRRTDVLKRRYDEFPPALRTAAGINTTAEDLARWLIALQQGRLLKTKAGLATLWAPVALNNGAPSGWALGWPARVRPEHRAVAGIGGMRSAFFVYPDDDLAVVILTNLSGACPEDFIDEVAGYFIPDMRAFTGFGLPPAIKAVHTELLKRGFGNAIEVVEAAKKRDAKAEFPEADVDAWGYRLLNVGRVKEAIEVFKLNVHLFPQSANTYDSLAEAYETAGNVVPAITNFKRSLELNPKNTNAVEHLKTLEANSAKNRSP